MAFNDSSLRQQRLSPASTLKIPHARIALEEGVLKPDEVFPMASVSKQEPGHAKAP
ncbi:hypothetical protein JKA73_09000 [Myxococcus xanthus]|uniref:penicillin-binding transpeptidase domain-containing protein n=1 Tax=Myxococcus xanthus TaxID=34 RepID=UPI0019178F47|nr:hypothetical protein JKA73_09000 [Myxococcus xanthus]